MDTLPGKQDLKRRKRGKNGMWDEIACFAASNERRIHLLS